ncbi:MAG: zinc-finger domain-containing protein, partial [Pseudomonadota bacterium]|nr:zinc-finger domain-containing protein [Pseudomonadota bacterium]
MASRLTPKFKNDKGVKEITIGVREFECIGASAPHDHPHIFLDMG